MYELPFFCVVVARGRARTSYTVSVRGIFFANVAAAARVWHDKRGVGKSLFLEGRELVELWTKKEIGIDYIPKRSDARRGKAGNVKITAVGQHDRLAEEGPPASARLANWDACRASQLAHWCARLVVRAALARPCSRARGWLWCGVVVGAREDLAFHFFGRGSRLLLLRHGG